MTYNRVCHLWEAEPEKGKGSGFRAMTVHDGEGVFGIFFNKEDLLESSISHEVKHLTDSVMDHIGANCKHCTQEPSAYLTGYLTSWIKRVLHRKNIRTGRN